MLFYGLSHPTRRRLGILEQALMPQTLKPLALQRLQTLCLWPEAPPLSEREFALARLQRQTPKQRHPRGGISALGGAIEPKVHRTDFGDRPDTDRAQHPGFIRF